MGVTNTVRANTAADLGVKQTSRYLDTYSSTEGSCLQAMWMAGSSLLHSSTLFYKKGDCDQRPGYQGGPALSLATGSLNGVPRFLWGVLGVKGGCENGRILATFCHTAFNRDPFDFSSAREVAHGPI